MCTYNIHFLHVHVCLHVHLLVQNQLRAKLQEKENKMADLVCSHEQLGEELATLREHLAKKERELEEVFVKNGAIQSLQEVQIVATHLEQGSSDGVNGEGVANVQTTIVGALDSKLLAAVVHEEPYLKAGDQELLLSEQVKIEEPLTMGDQKPLMPGDQEPLQIEGQESLKTGDQEQMKSEDQTPLETGNQEPLKTGDQEPLKTGDQEPLKTGDREPLKTGDQEPLKTGDQEPLKSGDQEPLKTGDEGLLKTGDQETLKSGDQAALKTGEMALDIRQCLVVGSEVVGSEVVGSEVTKAGAATVVAVKDTTLEEALAQVRQLEERLNSEREEKLLKIQQLEEELKRVQESSRTEGEQAGEYCACKHS